MVERIETEAALERKMSRLEQQRSRILEDINGSRPLAEILEEIAQMVSYMLDGAPCCCEMTNGARLGSCRAKAGLRVVREDIFGRAEPLLGTIFVSLDVQAQPAVHEQEALSTGARLAALAIETRRLYSDLLRRSEFDLLTDIPNRFSLEKHLSALIRETRESAGIFGLLYVDLDEFKQVNDVCGHHVGDLYLMEAVARMKQQLRPGDMLARLGGDEFAVLVPLVRGRAAAEEIASRLERCFEEPFAVEHYTLRFAASIGIAMYPEDATTQAGLLSAADSAMYEAKNIRRQIRRMEGTNLNPELAQAVRA